MPACRGVRATGLTTRSPVGPAIKTQTSHKDARVPETICQRRQLGPASDAVRGARTRVRNTIPRPDHSGRLAVQVLLAGGLSERPHISPSWLPSRRKAQLRLEDTAAAGSINSARQDYPPGDNLFGHSDVDHQPGDHRRQLSPSAKRPEGTYIRATAWQH